MRNHTRINAELKLLCRIYGNRRVDWAPDYSWVLVKDVRLPKGLNRTASDMLIMIPDGYGYGVPLKELYVDPQLRIWHQGTWREIPHYFDGDQPYSPNPLARERDWRYLCLHAEKWGPRDNILTFLDQVFTFFSDPFYPWKTRGGV